MIDEIKELVNDPLGTLFVVVWKVTRGFVRWNCGTIQTRRINDEYWSMPIPAAEWLSNIGAG